MVTIKKIKLLKNQIYLYLLMILRIKFFILIQLFIHQFYLKMIKNKKFYDENFTKCQDYNAWVKYYFKK